MDQNPIVVVGAGVAGLVCAIELQRAGRPVVVVESHDTVGGRVRTTRRDGLTLDHGFQVLFTAYPLLNRYLDPAALELRRFAPAARIVTSRGVSLMGDALRKPSLLFDTLRALPLADLLRLARLRWLARSLDEAACFSAQYDRHSTREFLAGRGFSAATIDGFFAPFYGGILLDRELSSSASILLYTLRMLSAGDTAVPARGMGAITAQLAAHLAPGTVRTRSAVRALQRDGAGVAAVLLADGGRIDTRHVVLATEAPAARALAATAGVPLAGAVEGRGCTTLYYRADQPPLPGKALWLGATPGAVVSHAVTLTVVAPEYADAGHLLAATVVGDAANLPDDALDAAARREVGGMAQLAGLPGTPLELAAVWRVPFAQIVQAPGFRSRRPPVEAGMPGLWRASEALHSSSLEGAARGGYEAARALLAAG